MKKRVLKITIAMLLLAFVYSTIVNALSFTVTMTPSSTNISESQEFMVTVKVANIDVGDDNGINKINGYLKYDETVFEKITESSIEGNNGWDPTYNADNQGKLTLTKTAFVESEENVFQVTFKTKENTNGKSGQIQFTNVSASNSADEVTASDISVTINVGAESSGNSVPISNTNTNTNTNTNRTIISANRNNSNNANTNNESGNILMLNTSNNVPSYVNESTNSSSDDIPYTGVEDTVMIAIVIILVVASVFYIKFEKINKQMK